MPPLLALPSSSTRAWNRYSSQVCASVCLAQGSPPPKRPSGPDRPARAGGTYRFAHLTPSANQALGPAVAPVLGKWPVWLQKSPANRQPGKCRRVCHPFELAWAACSSRHRNVRTVLLLGLLQHHGQCATSRPSLAPESLGRIGQRPA